MKNFFKAASAYLSNAMGPSAAPDNGNPAPSDAYASLREMVLTATPESIGLSPAGQEVWGVVMETAYPATVVTLVALADDTVSLYFSNGGGFIGMGGQNGPRMAGRNLIGAAQAFVALAAAAPSYDFPEPGMTRFYLLTGNGVLTAGASEEDLGNMRHAFSPLFHHGHNLMSEVRAVDEKAQ